MKNVFYINCFEDPWDKVAKKLHTEYGFEPVYWVGYREDASEHFLEKEFPQAIYHDGLDAWRGIFPELIASKEGESFIDIDFLKKYAFNELVAIKMLDRQDELRYDFSFMERQRHVRKLIKSWTACLDLLNPDLVITPIVPHRCYDYVLYLLCKYRNIPFVFFNHTAFEGRYIVLDELSSMGKTFVDDYMKFLEMDDGDIKIDDDINGLYEKVCQEDYNKALPKYMSIQEIMDRRWNNSFKIIKHVIGDIVVNRKKIFGQEGVLRNYNEYSFPYCKQKAGVDITNENRPLLLHICNLIKTTKYKKQLRAYYESLTVCPNYTDDKYVVVFLHYQPEATTCPIGDIFVDQGLMVDMLLKYLPKSYKIYVKEHPSQFRAHMEGHTGRIKEMYDDFKKNERIRLVSIYEDTFSLVDNSKAVVTISGTVGWEAMVRKKPVLLFGTTWYENYTKGVLRVYDEISASHMTEFVSSYTYDGHALKAYLASVGKNTRKAYYYKATHKNSLDITEEECVENIALSVMSAYNNVVIP